MTTAGVATVSSMEAREQYLAVMQMTLHALSKHQVTIMGGKGDSGYGETHLFPLKEFLFECAMTIAQVHLLKMILGRVSALLSTGRLIS